MKKFSLLLIRFYQKFLADPLRFGGACRFQPTCSEYTYEAVGRYGAFKGWRLGLTRLAHCHPLTTGGWDPVR